MIYPKTFEDKIGFGEIRSMLKGYCLGQLGRENVEAMTISDDVNKINDWLQEVREFRLLQEKDDTFPSRQYDDIREFLKRLRPEGTHLEEQELLELRRSLAIIQDMVTHLNYKDGLSQSDKYSFPKLQLLTIPVVTYPNLLKQIDKILDEYGRIKDSASPKLGEIRSELTRAEGSATKALYAILRSAQTEGLIDKDVSPSIRDGRLVIPVTQGLKRKIKGIIHDESATGKTVFIEPTEVVEINNRIRELEADERREILHILTEFSKLVRPHIDSILISFSFLGKMDLIRAKAELARKINAIEPQVSKCPLIDWIEAIHPLLHLSLLRQEKKAVPLDITLTKENRILIISGPNAGGKSVCLKTVGLLQYMLQSGLSVPMSERSKVGIFSNIFIDIGDEQSIENDLSTYSSHLTNMKNMIKFSSDRTLLLIDEFGAGTEPQIGAAIAEAVLRQFCEKKAYGVITTHYQNLKHFAENHDGVINGAMLYDRQKMTALFQLSIGNPGSSFAIEIARKTGLPEKVINDASEIVGSEYIQSDKYLQDIVRDKRYWEHKRQTIKQREKVIEETIAKYETEVNELEQTRKQVLLKAKEQAEELLRESNKKIENAIREIRESQAERIEAKRIRDELNAFKQEVENVDVAATDEMIERKIKQIQQRKERKEKKKKERIEKASQALNVSKDEDIPKDKPLEKGDSVRIKGLTSIGKLQSIDGSMATVIFGDMRTKMRLDRLERADTVEKKKPITSYAAVSRKTRETIDERKLHFKHEIDVRGMRGDEAINAVTYFIDDAILVGMNHVRILHGTGSGILRQLIRQYLSTVPNVKSYHDEHVQFGGAGITVVDIE